MFGVLIIFPASFCSFVETDKTYPYITESDHTFGRMVYFIFTSISIIGYNSQVTEDVNYMFLFIFLAYVFFQMPGIAADIMSIVGSKSPYAIARYDKINDETPHIVIIGQVFESNLQNLLDEYFHPDHCDKKRQCVVM